MKKLTSTALAAAKVALKFTKRDLSSLQGPAPKTPQINTPRPDMHSMVQSIMQIKEVIETREGQRGSAVDQAVTWRDLVGSGIAKINIDGVNYTGSGAGDVTPNGPLPDYSIPPAPTGLAAGGALANIILTWDDAKYSNHSYTEVWRSATNNLGTAVLNGTTQASIYTDNVGGGGTYYYWIRFVSTANVTGAFNAQAGVEGKTGTDPTYVKQVLLGKLGYEQFDIASGVFPITTVTALPTLPNTKYPVGVHVYLTGDGKLYRNKADKWTTEVAATDMTGQLTDAQLSAISAAKVSGQLTNAQLAAIDATKVTGQITGTQITDSAISTPKIAAGAIVTAKIAAGAVTAGEIAAGAVTTAKLAAGAVTANEIAAGAVVTAKLAAGAVTANEIAANTITADQLAANAITAGKIAAGAIVAGDGVISNLAVDTIHIADGAIKTAKIGNLAVDTAQIADLAVGTLKIADLAVNGAKIAKASITDAHIGSLNADKITAGSIRGISLHAATMGTLGTYLTSAIPLNADGTFKKYHEKLDVTTTQDFWQPVKGCTYDRPIDSTVMTVTCPVAHGLELDQRIKTVSLTTTSNAVDVDDYVRTIPNATTFTLSVPFNTHIQYSGTCDVMGLGAILGARKGSIPGTHTPFWYKDKTAITLVDIYPTDTGELPDSPVKTSVVPFHKLSMSFDAANNGIFLVGPREKGTFNVPFALNQNDQFLCTMYAPPTKGALNVTSNQGGNTARFDNGAVTSSAARAIYATANSDGVGVHAIGRNGGFFETHFRGTGIGVEGYSYAGSGVLGRGRKIGVEGHSTNLESGAFDFYASGAASNMGPFTGSHDGLMLKNSTWTEGDIIVDDLIIHRKNISNAIAQNSLSSKPMQKGVIGVLSSVTQLTRESPPSALVAGYNEVVTVQPASGNPDENQVKDTQYVPILVDNYDDLALKYDRISFNAVGEGLINVCKEGGNLETGDLICASSTPGKGMKQLDDVVRGYTVAKVRENVVWDATDDTIKKVACIYLCG